ncbi:MAG TPA: hypothetical protein VGR35_04640 [Tepidisphaeraceae bacterium]|nr:hypothetical protein [Tepidisphaeraceae bacterium]
MRKLLMIGLVTALLGCDDVEEGKPDAPEVTRPIEIDRDKETLDGRIPPPPNSEDTATSPGQNTPTTNPAPAAPPAGSP